MKQHMRKDQLLRTILFTSFLMLTLPAAFAKDSRSYNPMENNIMHDPTSNGLYLSWIDPGIAPQDNYYGYANGAWQKQNPIPADRSVWSAFTVLQEKNQQAIRSILIEASHNTIANSIQQKIGDFYMSGMDENQINQQGIKPLQPEFDRIKNIVNLTDLQHEIVHLHRMGLDVLFNFGSMHDFNDSQHMIGGIMQGGLSLPDRDYYLKKDPKFLQIQNAFLQHMQQMFILLGDTPSVALSQAKTVMRLETKLAEASMSQVQQRDPYAVYHLTNVDKLNQTTPGFSWNNYFQALGLTKMKQVNLGMPDYLRTMNQLLHSEPLEDWKTYLRWHLLDSFSSYLSTPFIEQNFKFDSMLTGTKKLLPRWQRVVTTENKLLGFAIGEIYVKRYFSAAAKQEILGIIHNIRKALQADLEHLPWMSQKTRTAALAKLAAMEERVGYPEKWWDYSKLMINRGPYVLNVIRASQFLVQRDLNKIDKPVDRLEWDMTPQTINAYYDPSMNSINIPAGILQAPFFDPQAPSAVNYGAIGFVIGHEITHGFDDQGAKFDAHGNLADWWTKEDLKRFRAATECIIQQYSNYQINQYHINGNLVVGEATADLGGLTLAYRAFQASKAFNQSKTLNGLTPEQQFFLSSAHVWAANIRPEQTLHQITTDPHPPARYRVNGTLANMPAFQKSYRVPDDSRMVNPHRCLIW